MKQSTSRDLNLNTNIAVVIPCYKVKSQIVAVINSIPAFVSKIYLIDDSCPEQSGLHARENNSDPRLEIIYNQKNLGVGGAVIAGYKKALADGMNIVVKIDGDGQMDPSLIVRFIKPLLLNQADYTKGNRFFNLESLVSMPPLRLFGNAALSFVNKVVSGYWNLMDPSNGYTAISRFSLARLPLDKLDQRYFFESDMLFRLGILRAVIKDIPMDSVYSSEESNLKINQVLVDFPPKYLARIFKRLFYNYFLRDFTVVSISLILGLGLTIFGATIGVVSWVNNASAQTFASTGTVMLATLPILVGIQLLLIAIVLDILNVPTQPLSEEGGSAI